MNYKDRYHDPPSRIHHSSFIIYPFPWARLASLLVLLAVLVALIVRLQDPDVARLIGGLLAPQGPATPQKAGRTQEAGRTDFQSVQSPKDGLPFRPTDAAPPPKPATDVPLGPTDEDESEAAEAREEFQAVADGTLAVQLRDMFALRRVVQWVINQPASLMEKRAKAGVTFNDLMLSPEEYRGTLLALDLRARLIRKFDDPKRFDVPLYEIWGSTRDSGAWLYDVMVIDPPSELREAAKVNVDLRVVGYFFKLQGYQPAKAKPGARPERAPLLIGRVVWSAPMPAETPSTDWPWAGLLLGIFAAILAVRLGFFVFRRRGKARGIVTTSPRPGTTSIEEWFDHAAAGDAPEEEDEGERTEDEG
jgi:hypothetical protein